MMLPCAYHLANHALVQELALAAAFTATVGVSCPPKPYSGNLYYEAARRIACSTWSVEESLSYSPPKLYLDPTIRAMLLSELKSVSRETLGEAAGSENFIAEEQASWIPVKAPAYHVALYGLHAPLPTLPNYIHDDVTYDEACQHVQLLHQLLEPYGFVVQLSGATRRGAPVGRVAELSLALTEAAVREIEEQEVLVTEVVEGAARQLEKSCYGEGDKCVKHNTFALSAMSPAIVPIGGVSAKSYPGDADGRELLRQLPFRWCSDYDVVSSADVVSAAVRFRYIRAFQVLFQSGYVAAGRLPASQHWHEKHPSTKVFTLRFDPYCPTKIPARHIKDVAMRGRMKLHQIVLDVVPWNAMHVREFFRTGPAAFSAYVTMLALQRGLELNLNGLFLCYPSLPEEKRSGNASNPDAGPGLRRKQILVQSERDIFRLVGLPYIDPLSRAIYCQKNNITLSTTD